MRTPLTLGSPDTLTRAGNRKVHVCLKNLCTLTGSYYFASLERKTVLTVRLQSKCHTSTLPLVQGLDY